MLIILLNYNVQLKVLLKLLFKYLNIQRQMPLTTAETIQLVIVTLNVMDFWNV